MNMNRGGGIWLLVLYLIYHLSQDTHTPINTNANANDNDNTWLWTWTLWKKSDQEKESIIDCPLSIVQVVSSFTFPLPCSLLLKKTYTSLPLSPRVLENNDGKKPKLPPKTHDSPRPDLSFPRKSKPVGESPPPLQKKTTNRKPRYSR